MIHADTRGLVEFVPIARFCAEEHRARVDGRATARHLHGIIERAVRCGSKVARLVGPGRCSVRGLVEFVPVARFSAKEHRARVDGRATARHLHGIIERTVRCYTAKVSAESAGAVASTMFLESLPTRQSGRLAQPDGGAGTPAGRGCHLQGRSAPPSWTTP